MDVTLATEDLSFAYGGRVVLDSLSLKIKKGEFVGLIGANGTGKTTLLRLLLGILPAQSGEVYLNGDSIRMLSRREVARRATLVQQDTRIDFGFTGREIVAMGRTPYLGRFTPEGQEDREIVERSLEETETGMFARRLVTELSGGERQRVHIARAIAQETDIILLDEPTANLDLTHQFDVLRLIQKLVKSGKTALAAIHDLTIASSFCDRLILIWRGRIVAHGVPEDVITEENLKKYFALSARIRKDEESEGIIIYPLRESFKK